VLDLERLLVARQRGAPDEREAVVFGLEEHRLQVQGRGLVPAGHPNREVEDAYGHAEANGAARGQMDQLHRLATGQKARTDECGRGALEEALVEVERQVGSAGLLPCLVVGSRVRAAREPGGSNRAEAGGLARVAGALEELARVFDVRQWQAPELAASSLTAKAAADWVALLCVGLAPVRVEHVDTPERPFPDEGHLLERRGRGEGSTNQVAGPRAVATDADLAGDRTHAETGFQLMGAARAGRLCATHEEHVGRRLRRMRFARVAESRLSRLADVLVGGGQRYLFLCDLGSRAQRERRLDGDVECVDGLRVRKEIDAGCKRCLVL